MLVIQSTYKWIFTRLNDAKLECYVRARLRLKKTEGERERREQRNK